ERVVKLLERNTKQQFPFITGKPGYKPQAETITAWTDYIRKQWPNESATALGGTADLEQLHATLAQVAWNKGDAARGQQFYEKRGCTQCHGGRSALGPDLAGVAERFSREDLFTAILLPSRDVPARYQTTMIVSKDGKSFSGMVVYESVDGLLLRNALQQTFRIEAADIDERRASPVSLMPTGLLKDLTSADYADLYAYIASLGKRSTTVSATEPKRP
ncbi:MAG TPA: c-type cytochrome, partial [Planctomycetaceae bacterium]|nr:c-type cytochrome [Planctomycetaceae bacterium]